MKTFYGSAVIFIIAISTITLYSQSGDFKSVVTPPPSFNPSPNGTRSLDVTANGFDNFYLGIDFGEPYIANNPRDPLNNFCAFNINSLYYTVDGVNWIRNTPQFPGFAVIGDPVMCFDSLGTAFYVQLYQNGNTYGICVVKSTDKGVTWGSPVGIWATTQGLADKEWIAADQTAGPYSNNLYVANRQFGSSGMRFFRSTDHGATWSSPLTISGNQGAYIAVGPNGNIQGGSVYFGCIGNGVLLVNRSIDGGQTFSAQVNAVNVIGPGVICAGRNTVKNCIRTDAFPRMAADNSYTSSRGNVYIAYADNPPGVDNADIFVVRSTDYGITWSSPVRVNDDATTTDQWMPTISVDNITGKIFVAWYDSRVDPSGNLLTRLYGATSTNGGVSFTTNGNISDVSFNPNSMAVGQPGGENYIGDYIGITAIRNTSYAVWMDGRNNNLGSFTGYYPDFALLANPLNSNMVNGDSVFITATVPAIKGPYTGAVKFTATLDSLPTSGNLLISFVNGKDSVTAFPDSVKIRVKATGSVNPRLFKLNIKGTASNGLPPVHLRTVNLLVNSSYLNIGTNRGGSAQFKVNGITYNSTQALVFPNGSVATVQALSPFTIGTAKRYVFVNWTDNGDTTHNVTINSNVNLTAIYKTQFRLTIVSDPGNTFGGNIFYDSAATFTFGVLSRNVLFNGTLYHFVGWNGGGGGSYTSPDSTGADSSVTWSMSQAIAETARWTTPIGIHNLSTEIPREYKLYQNYPNPFNPSTEINFDIIKDGNVKISIYNVLGQEVATIVNENVKPGKYKADFNAENLASGIYFYKLVTNDFVNIKKMVVVK